MRLRKYRRQYSQYGRRIWPSASFFKVRLNAAKITLVFAILGMLTLFFIDYRNQQLSQTIKTTLIDTTLPFFDLGAEVTKTVTAEIRDFFSPYKKYEHRLQEQDNTIQFWKLEVQRLRKEIQLLKDLLDYKEDFKLSAITSQLFIPQGHQFGHKGFLSIGSNKGIKKDSIVVSTHGLVGKVTTVGNKTAEVLLLTHHLSAIPIYVERTNALGIMKGNIRQGCILEYVNPTQLEDGDRLLTSGQGGVFPRGINVAVIKKKLDNIQITPLHKLATTVFVYVLPPKTEKTSENVDK